MQATVRRGVQRALVISLTAAVAAAGLIAAPATAAEPPVADRAGMVNTFIGTQDQGNTFPGASAPFGMAQVSPTGSHFAGWEYDQTSIRGFGHSYISGAGCWEQGGLLSALPTVGTVAAGGTFDPASANTFDHRRYAATLTHDGEVGAAGYYKTRLTSYGGIDVEATASTRVGVQRYTFPASANANVFLNTGQANQTLKVTSSKVDVVDDRTVVSEITVQGFCTGKDYTYTTWFATRFDRPFASFGTWNPTGGAPGVKSQAAGTGLKGAWLTFDTRSDRTVQLSTGLSFTGAAGALANLEGEGLDAAGAPKSFDTVRAATRDEWNRELGKVRVTSSSPDDLTTFYTSLYHAFLQPITSSDIDGTYMGFDKRTHVAKGWTYYQWLSLWDTYRTQNQLLAMVQPERAADIARSVLTIQQQGGWLPRWAYANYEGNVMTGDPASPFLADLWRFGAIRGGVTLDAADTLSGQAVELDEQLALRALLQNVDTEPGAESQFAGRSGIKTYLANGYVAQDAYAAKKGMDEDRQHAGSATMEYAIGDCAVGEMALALGDAQDGKRLKARAANWKNVWDPAAADALRNVTGFPRSKNAAGTWSSESPTTAQVGFHEGTPWQYQWLAWQDAEGLAKQVGGESEALRRLDLFFDAEAVLANPATAARESWVVGTLEYNGRYEYNPNNEPNLHAAWMYNFFGKPAMTSAVNRAAQSLFTNAPDGVTGNDDLGTMSAWYVFSALGVYPSVAGSGELLLHAPRFSHAEIDLGGKTLVIDAPGADASKLQYVGGATLGGAPVTTSYLSWDRIRQGGTLAYTLTDDVKTTWATAGNARPTSLCSTVADDVAPIATLSVDPKIPASGWATGDVQVSVGATDDRDPAPEKQVRVDGGEWTAVDEAVTVSGDGRHTVEARAIDRAGNESAVVTTQIRVDATAPKSTITPPSAAPGVILVGAADAGSGVARTEYRLTQQRVDTAAQNRTASIPASARAATLADEDWATVPSAGIPVSDTGTYRVEVRSTDRAGNVEEPVSLEFTLSGPTTKPTPIPSTHGGDPEAGGLAVTGASDIGPGIGALAFLALLAGGVLIARRREKLS